MGTTSASTNAALYKAGALSYLGYIANRIGAGICADPDELTRRILARVDMLEQQITREVDCLLAQAIVAEGEVQDGR